MDIMPLYNHPISAGKSERKTTLVQARAAVGPVNGQPPRLSGPGLVPQAWRAVARPLGAALRWCHVSWHLGGGCERGRAAAAAVAAAVKAMARAAAARATARAARAARAWAATRAVRAREGGGKGSGEGGGSGGGGGSGEGGGSECVGGEGGGDCSGGEGGRGTRKGCLRAHAKKDSSVSARIGAGSTRHCSHLDGGSEKSPDAKCSRGPGHRGTRPTAAAAALKSARCLRRSTTEILQARQNDAVENRPCEPRPQLQVPGQQRAHEQHGDHA